MSKTLILLLVCPVVLTLSGLAGVIGDATEAMSWTTLAVGAASAAIILSAWLRAKRREG